MKKILTIALIGLMTQVSAARIKVGVLAPEGTNWAKHMKKMGKEIKTATKGKVKFNYCPVDFLEEIVTFYNFLQHYLN